MLGAIIGDIIGSPYEHHNHRSTDFALFSERSRFTDDTVPQALTAFLESTDYEDAVRKAVSIGGDSDTIACIAGGIAHAYFKHIPPDIEKAGLARLDKRLLKVVSEFSDRYL